MVTKKYGIKMPDIGCTISQIGISTDTHGNEIPQFKITPNDPEAYQHLIEIVDADCDRVEIAKQKEDQR